MIASSPLTPRLKKNMILPFGLVRLQSLDGALPHERTTINAELAEPAEKLVPSTFRRIIHELFQRLGPFASKTVGASRLGRTKNAV